MSTKVYEGMAFNGPMEAFYRVLGNFSETVLGWSKIAQLRVVIGRCVRELDHARFFSKPVPTDLFLQYMSSLHGEYLATYDRTTMDQESQFEVHVLAYPVFVLGTQKVLHLLYSAYPDPREMWGAHEGIHQWPYWNNTDAPDDVSKEEWDTRRIAWEQALDRNPLRYECIGRYNLPLVTMEDAKDNLPMYLPTLEERSTSLARKILVGQKYGEGDVSPETAREMMSWLRSSDYQGDLLRMTQRVASVLDPDLTFAAFK